MEIVPVYVGLDYHSSSVRVCVLSETGEMLFNKSVPNEIGSVIAAIKEGPRVDRALVRGVALEACGGTADFAEQLIAATEWDVKLAHATTVEAMKKGPNKTDHGDAWFLAHLLRTGGLPEVWLADAQTRQLRRLARHRQTLAEDSRKIKLRIRALLKEERLEENCPCVSWTKTWRKWLAQQESGLGKETWWILSRELQRLDELLRNIDEVTRHIEEVTREDAIVQALLEEDQVGIVTALLLRAVIGRFSRFRSGKHLAAYCSTAPCNRSSGKRQSDSGLINAGHPDLRAALIQLAKRLPRSGGHWSELAQKLRRRKAANVVSAAIANRWLRRLYHRMKEIEATRITACPVNAA